MNRKTLVTVALVGAIFCGGGVADAAENKSDWTTLLNVKLALLEKLGTDSLKVEVDAQGGALTLSGTVDKRETRELSETVAKSVKGVASVKNDLLLAASEANPSGSAVVVGEAEAEVKDAVLVTRVRMALVRRMGAEGFQIGTQAAKRCGDAALRK